MHRAGSPWRARFRMSLVIVCILEVCLPLSEVVAAGHRLEEIRARGRLICGIWPQVPGFATKQHGQYLGFDVDICRAVAATIFGDPTKVEFTSLPSVDQFRRREDIDLAMRRLTWTLSRETSTGMNFGPVTFYDGQGFLMPKRNAISRLSQLAGHRICVLNMERHPETLANYFRDRGWNVQLILVGNDREAEAALLARRCAAYSADVSWLAAARVGFTDGLARYDILEQLISKEPLAPLMRANDAELLRLVRWTIYVMIEAEELGLNSRNVGRMQAFSPAIQRLLTSSPDLGDAAESTQRVGAVIGGVGNFGEVFERNLGSGSAIKLDRGLNRLWTNGGLMYAPPF
jgi:general L-amino acid transport system substrate-binding protein